MFRTNLGSRARRSVLAAALVCCALPPLAMGQATRTWVSGVGDDANPCSRTAPCKTLAGAISKTAAGGEINVLDPGGFGGVTIAKAMTIRSVGVEAGVLVSGTSAIVINAPDTARVVLSGLDINGLGTGLKGVNIISAGNVRIENSQINGFTQAGVWFADSTPHAQLEIRNTAIYDNPGNNAPGADPPAGTTPAVSVIPTAATSSKQKVTIRDSSLDDNQGGLVIDGSTHGVAALMTNTSVSDNDGPGVSATGAYTTIRLYRNEIFDNLVGLATAGGGSIFSMGGNVIAGNITDGAPTSTTPASKCRALRAKKGHRSAKARRKLKACSARSR